MREEFHLETFAEVELYFEDIGPIDAPTLIFVPGLGYNSFAFREAVGDLLTDYRVIYTDPRGSGRSGPLEADGQLFTFDAMAEDLERIREFLGISSFTPIGHAFGAVIALEYARRWPERSDRAIVVNPWVHYPELAQILLKRAARIRDLDPEQELAEAGEEPERQVERAFSLVGARDLLAQLHFPLTSSRLQLEHLDAESGLFGSGVVAEGFVTNGLWSFEYPIYLSELQVPVGVIAGTLDPTSYPEQTDFVVDLSEADLILLEGGHYPWIESPEAFVEALNSLVQTN